jgi:hypothetical protein
VAAIVKLDFECSSLFSIALIHLTETLFHSICYRLSSTSLGSLDIANCLMETEIPDLIQPNEVTCSVVTHCSQSAVEQVSRLSAGYIHCTFFTVIMQLSRTFTHSCSLSY